VDDVLGVGIDWNGTGVDLRIVARNVEIDTVFLSGPTGS